MIDHKGVASLQSVKDKVEDNQEMETMNKADTQDMSEALTKIPLVKQAAGSAQLL